MFGRFGRSRSNGKGWRGLRIGGLRIGACDFVISGASDPHRPPRSLADSESARRKRAEHAHRELRGQL
eukprot:15430218-Alexandrium_andersonii.AAC.1